MKLARLSIGIVLIVALSALAAVVLQQRAFMGGNFWPNFLGVLFAVGICAAAIALDVRARAKTDPVRINKILEQFPGPITFSALSSRRMRVMAVACVVAAAMLIFIGIMGHGLHTGHPEPQFGGTLVMFSFAAVCLAFARIAVVQLRSGSLRLDETGFESIGYRHRRYLWSEVTDIRRVFGRYFDFVGFRIVPPTDPEARRNLRFTGGADDRLPDDYGFYIGDLAQVMAAWQNRAANTNAS